jgi:transposase-like protein
VGCTKKKPPELEAAIMAALLAGQGVMEVAQQFNVSHATVSRIKSRLSEDDLNGVERKKTDRFGDLLAEYLEETIITLKAQTRFFRDEKWLEKQSASEVAVLHGVCADKGLRLLEAIERSSAFEDEEEQPNLS